MVHVPRQGTLPKLFALPIAAVPHTHSVLEGRDDLRVLPGDVQGVGVDVIDLPRFFLLVPIQLHRRFVMRE